MKNTMNDSHLWLHRNLLPSPLILLDYPPAEVCPLKRLPALRLLHLRIRHSLIGNGAVWR